MRTGLTGLLGIDLPIVQVPIGGATSPELPAAVSNAGGLDTPALSLQSPDAARHAIRATRELTDRPFGVNLILEWSQAERLQACLEEGVELVSLFWGDPAPHVEAVHAAGARTVEQVSVLPVSEGQRSAQGYILNRSNFSCPLRLVSR